MIKYQLIGAAFLILVIIFLAITSHSNTLKQVSTVTSSPSSSSTTYPAGSLQEILHNNCHLAKLQNYVITNGVAMDKYLAIEIDKLPVNIKSNPAPSASCFTEDYEDSINVDRDIKINHEGVSLVFSKGSIALRDNDRPLIDGTNGDRGLIKTTNDINYYANIGTGGDGGFYTTYIYWWGVREITLKTGEKLYATAKTQEGAQRIYIASDDHPLPTSLPNVDSKTFLKTTVENYFKDHPLSNSQTQPIEDLLNSVSD